MKINIVTPDREVFDGEAKGITLPGNDGSFQIWEDHASLISSLGKGELKIHPFSGEDDEYEVEGGAVEVHNNKVTVLVEVIF